MPVLGIGGLFFRARDPDALSDWYRQHLGMGGRTGNIFAIESLVERNRSAELLRDLIDRLLEPASPQFHSCSLSRSKCFQLTSPISRSQYTLSVSVGQVWVVVSSQ